MLPETHQISSMDFMEFFEFAIGLRRMNGISWPQTATSLSEKVTWLAPIVAELTELNNLRYGVQPDTFENFKVQLLLKTLVKIASLS